ncbi:hypothetical protein TNCV_342051 [Trichonephila clavipes]|nr:hypothetical protein TNCV_342051 [Trichonephila clavipes]
MGRTLTRFKQHRVTTTRLMNCYAVLTRLRRSGHHLWMYPLHHGQNPYKIQTAPGYYYKTDELLRCFNKITTLQTFFSFSPIRTWTAVRDQESVNQESVNQESVTRSPTATAGSDVVQSGRPIFDDFFQHLWPYIGINTANVVFQMVKRLWLIHIDQ